MRMFGASPNRLCLTQEHRYEIPDTPQFRGGNPYFFRENLYQSVSFIYASMYRENVHAIHIAMQLANKIATLCFKNQLQSVPGGMSEILHFAVFPSIPYFCEKILHFGFI